MKQLHLITIISFTILMSACSQQRYAHIPKVKVNQQAENTVKPVKKKNIQETAPATTEVIESTEQLQANDPAKTASKQEKAAEVKLPKRLMEKVEKKVAQVINTLPQEQILKMVAPVNVNQPSQVQEENDSVHISEHWLKIIIIGLVLLLIAFFLPSPLGSIVGLIGSILIVVGLIFLLLSLI